MKNLGNSSYIIFNSIGPAEKDLAGTAVVGSIKMAYPKKQIIVISKNPEVWLHNPDVFRVYRLGVTPYFYQDFVKGKDSTIFWQDPYQTDDAIHKRKNLIEIWSKLCNVPIRETEPRLFFTFREFEATERMLAANIPLNFRQSLCAEEMNRQIKTHVKKELKKK